jgi:hypothetical protein
MKRIVFALAFALAAARPAHAYFEQTDIGARIIALGPSAMAGVGDVSAYRWNPAALATLRRPELLLDWGKPWGVENLSENGIAAGASHWGTGFAVAWHRLGIPDAYAEDQFCIAAGRTLLEPRGGHAIDAGATFKFGRVAFQPFTVGGTSLDYGAQSKGDFDVAARWRTPWSVDFSWVSRNLLQPRYELVDGSGGDLQVPRQEIAASIRWNRESTISMGWAQQPHGAATLSAGMEIQFFDVFSIRSGLRNISRVYEAQQSPNDLQFSGGFGVFNKGYYVDAGAETSRDLGATYRVSLRFPLARGAR